MAAKKLTPEEKAKNARQKARREKQVLSGAVVERAKKIYGSVVNLYNIPEIKNLIDQGYINQWTPEEFLRQLDNTEWARSRTAAQETFDILESTDATQAQARVEPNVSLVRRVLTSKNLSMPEEEIQRVARIGTRNGWSQIEFDDNVAVEAMRAAPTAGVSQAAPQKTDLRTIAKQFGIRITDSDLDTWANDIVTNRRTLDQFQEQVRQSAQTLYPTIAERLQTATFEDIVAPYRAIYEQTMEMPGEDADFSSPLYSQVFNAGDQGQPRMMNSLEFTRFLRQRPEWQNTQNAYREYAGAADVLNRIFGGTR